jgi:predicted nucleotidyltransferase
MGRVRIEIPQDRLAAFCRTHRIRRLSVFGSALREDFRPDSDVDLLVSFEEGARYSLFDLVIMQDELQAILGREVDLVEARRWSRARITSGAVTSSRMRNPSMWRDDACLLDMLIAARKIRAFTDGVTLDHFLHDELM